MINQDPIIITMKLIVDKVSEVTTPYLKTINPSYENVRFDFGHPSELLMRLENLSKTEKFRYSKYPLIGVFLDFKETKGVRPDYYSSVALNMFICCGTDNNFSSFERLQKKFIPILYPVYDEFLNQVTLSKSIENPPISGYKHDKVDRYQWGREGIEYYKDGKANVFNDFIDAIEIRGLELNFLYKCKK